MAALEPFDVAHNSNLHHAAPIAHVIRWQPRLNAQTLEQEQ